VKEKLMTKNGVIVVPNRKGIIDDVPLGVE
jgi:hypothetical protein